MSGAALPFAWTPSAARVITLFETSFASLSLRQPSVIPLRWPDTPAGLVLDYGLDCTALLTDDDMIAAVTIDAGELQVVAMLNQAGIAYVWLSGGERGTDYPVDMTIVTVAGRTVNRVVRLMVV